jgi:hypothetical protein
MKNSNVILITFIILLISMAVLSCSKGQPTAKDNLILLMSQLLLLTQLLLMSPVK